MHTRAALATVTGLALGFALACGVIGSGPDSLVDYRSSAYTPPSGADAYPALDRAYRVPPDRASVAVTLQVREPEAAAAGSQLTSEIAAVTKGAGDRCTAALQDASPPTPAGSAEWSASAEVRVDIDLKGLPTVEERRAKIDACLAGIDPLVTRDEWKKVAAGERQVQRSAPVLSVDDPTRHRDALLDRARAELTWAAAAAGAPQLHPEDLRCVPDGIVHAGDARLSGVVLTLGMTCRVDDEEEPEVE